MEPETSASVPEPVQRTRRIVRRLEQMGLAVEVLPGQRCAVATLPLGPDPVPTPGGPRRVRAIRFATVGADRIKCLVPRAFFYLPLLPIADCRDAAALEQRIRSAWRERLELLGESRRWLEGVGIEPEPLGGAPLWAIPLGLGEASARPLLFEPRHIILPSAGTLSGIALSEPKERISVIEPGAHGPSDVEITLANRVEALAADAAVEEERRRRARAVEGPLEAQPATTDADASAPVLLVGPSLANERTLHERLRLRGFEVAAVRSMREALEAFHERSFELVLADVRLDRADGVELIPAIHALPGVERMPIVLVDERMRNARRDAARAAGAAGYLPQPLRIEQVAPMLLRLVERPRRRRFLRYPRPVGVASATDELAHVATPVARRGAFLRTPEALPAGTRTTLELYAPELAAPVRVEAEVVGPFPADLERRAGVGVRFRSFARGDEAAWIAFLRALEAGTAPAPEAVPPSRPRSGGRRP